MTLDGDGAADHKMTPEELGEVARRIAQGMPAGMTDAELEAAMRALAADGLLEVKETPDGPQFRMTDTGTAEAEALVADILADPPPRGDALLHLMSVVEADYPGTDRAKLSGIAEVILHIEHHRLADIIGRMHESGSAVDAHALAESLRQGLL